MIDSDIRVMLGFISGLLCSYWGMKNNVSGISSLCIFVVCLIPTLALAEIIIIIKELLWNR